MHAFSCRGGCGAWVVAGLTADTLTVARAEHWQGLRSTTDATGARAVGVHLWGYKGQSMEASDRVWGWRHAGVGAFMCYLWALVVQASDRSGSEP